MAGAVDLGAHYVCRREVYDALAAAEGQALPYEELRDAVGPRLRKFALKEIENVGMDAYLKARLDHFAERNGTHRKMISIRNDGTIALIQSFKLKVNLPNGKSVTYEPGLAIAVERIDRLNQNISEMRMRGKWDCLPPSPQKGARAELEDSIARMGWLHDQHVIADRSGFIIDGRVRNSIISDAGGTRATMRLNGRGLPEAFGLIYSFYANQSRLTGRQQNEYKDRLQRELGVSWDELLELHRITFDWQTAPPRTSINPRKTIKVHATNVTVSEDLNWVKIRDITKRDGSMSTYNVKDIKNMLIDLGCDCIQPNKDGSQSSAWMRVDDIPRIVDIGSDDLPIWPSSPEKRKMLTSVFADLIDLRDLAREQVAAGAAGTIGP